MADNVTDADRALFKDLLYCDDPFGASFVEQGMFDHLPRMQKIISYRTQSVEEATGELVELLDEMPGIAVAAIYGAGGSQAIADVVRETLSKITNDALTKYQSKATNKDREHDTD